MYTELELVNHILKTLGESVTPTLVTQHPAVLQARTALALTNKEFQSSGWWFNKEKNLKLLPDSDGRVRIPDETLEFAVTKCLLDERMPSQKQRFVKRGDFVYDVEKHTNKLSTAIWADITVLLDVSDLPAAAGTYLKHLAAQTAFLDDDGDTSVYRLLTFETDRAWGMLKQAELKAVAANQFESPHALALRAGVGGLGSSGRNSNYLGGGR
ncbi:tail adapter protein [Rhizobium phage Palo]|uniref:Tail adapter protein n=1 Tax=Rhizobium phage Palo TaxID=2767573 RepID=A0A7L8G4L6_9CAUD|nr:tail adapter protein [Rhizobium phage Palo]